MQEKTQIKLEYLRLVDMTIRYRVSGSTIWNWIHTNGLPSPIKFGPNTSLWSLTELQVWEKTRKVRGA